MDTEKFRDLLTEDLRKFSTSGVDDNLWEWLRRRIYYVSGNFADPALYSKLQETLKNADSIHNTHGNYFFYLATSPSFFSDDHRQFGACD